MGACVELRGPDELVRVFWGAVVGLLVAEGVELSRDVGTGCVEWAGTGDAAMGGVGGSPVTNWAVG